MRLGKWMAVIGAMGIGTVAALGSQGCTVSTGTENDGGFTGTDANGGETGPTEDAGPDADAAPVSDPCNECLFGQCAAYWSVCNANSECQAIYACATKAGCGETCVTDCYNAHPNGQRDYHALAQCDQVSACGTCQSQCNPPTDTCTVPDAGPQDAAVDAPTLDACNQCQADNCSAEKSKCQSGSDCQAYNLCSAPCQDQACLDACGAQHPQGKTDATALGACTVTNCAAKCF